MDPNVSDALFEIIVASSLGRLFHNGRFWLNIYLALIHVHGACYCVSCKCCELGIIHNILPHKVGGRIEGKAQSGLLLTKGRSKNE